MNIVRQLNVNEYDKWDEFVTRSPQGSLFQTIAWNKMLCQTDPELEDILLLASINEKEVIQAGMITCYRRLNGKKMLYLPPVGYVFPILSPDLHYEERHHTYGNYLILVDLIQRLVDQAAPVRLKNSPEIWDIRTYYHQSWHIDTVYTYLWRNVPSERNGAGLSVDGQAMSANLTLKTDEYWADLHSFIKIPGDKRVFQKRLDWLRDKGLCRLFVAVDAETGIAGMCLALLSRENNTAYVWDAGCANPASEKEALPFLFRQCWQNLSGEFSCLDFGPSTQTSIARIKDQLGCIPVPFFITTSRQTNRRNPA